MIEIDETDLISFFGVMPEPQPEEEREFFAAPQFIKSAGGITMTFSASANHDDLFLDLALAGSQDHLLEYRLKDVESVVIESDRDGRLWLRARSRSAEHVAISVAPSILVRIHGAHAA